MEFTLNSELVEQIIFAMEDQQNDYRVRRDSGQLLRADEIGQEPTPEQGEDQVDADVVESCHGDDIASTGFSQFYLFESFVTEQFGDACFRYLTVFHDQGYCFTGSHATVKDLSGRDTAEVIVVVDVGDKHLEGCFGVSFRGFDDIAQVSGETA